LLHLLSVQEDGTDDEFDDDNYEEAFYNVN
jgi:hypothetical protein